MCDAWTEYYARDSSEGQHRRWSLEEAKIAAFCSEGSEDGEGEKGGLRWKGRQRERTWWRPNLR